MNTNAQHNITALQEYALLHFAFRFGLGVAAIDDGTFRIVDADQYAFARVLFASQEN